MSTAIVLATHSVNKINEIKAMLADLPVLIQSGIDLQLPEAEENGTTFEENALIKARSSAQQTNILSLADDSGFCIPALNNFPGLVSKRWANGNYGQAFQRLADRLAEKNMMPPVPAFFQTVLVLAWPGGGYRTYQGTVEGHFVMPARPLEDQGRAYDAVFVPLGQSFSPLKTFGEMTLQQKGQFSHRARAVQAFKKDFPWTA